jgi:hypothetical protein
MATHTQPGGVRRSLPKGYVWVTGDDMVSAGPEGAEAEEEEAAEDEPADFFLSAAERVKRRGRAKAQERRRVIPPTTPTTMSDAVAAGPEWAEAEEKEGAVEEPANFSLAAAEKVKRRRSCGLSSAVEVDEQEGRGKAAEAKRAVRIARLAECTVMDSTITKGGHAMRILKFDREMERCRPGKCIQSNVFSVQNKPFTSLVYPSGTGHHEDYKEMVSVGVRYEGEGEVRVESLKITATDKGGAGTVYAEGDFFQEGEGYTIGGWCLQQDCLDNLKNGVFEIQVEIEFMGENIVTRPRDVKDISESKARCFNDLMGLLGDTEQADFVLKCGGQQVPCHRNILGARSSAFRQMLASNMAEKGEVEIDDVKPEILRKVVEFIYTGEVGVMAGRAVELLYAADKYGLEDLVRLCAAECRGEVTPASAARILLLADRHQLSGLKQVVLGKIRKEKATYVADPEFTRQIKGQSDLLFQLFSL